MTTLRDDGILTHLGKLEEAVDLIANAWRPDDPAYRADIYRQIMMSFSFSYFLFFHADPEHPDWTPLWNPVYMLQPNPDDIYFYAPLRGDRHYKVSGDRGTVRLLTFTTGRSMVGLRDPDTPNDPSHVHDLDDRVLTVSPDGQFEVIFSATRPDGYTGDWAEISPQADYMMVRCRSYDWGVERDPNLVIECLDPAPLKPRLTPDEIMDRIAQMAAFPERTGRTFLAMQNGVRDRVGINVFEPVRYPGGLSQQVYWPAAFEFEYDEALILETEMPGRRHYWNIQLNDPYFNACEFVYRLSSLNAATAALSSDGRLRCVISLEDPGVPNWLDPAGFKQGTIYGRWYDCDTYPLPTLKRVKLADLSQHLPADTPKVTLEERAEILRKRVRGAQLRRRW
jgi:hypothetical protein